MSAFDWMLLALWYCGVGNAVMASKIEGFEHFAMLVFFQGWRFVLTTWALVTVLWPLEVALGEPNNAR